ncbi:MFS transporter [Paractinoplanes atraurantiacus]|uniref:Transmembrane secretion effector n=1 Tax=Paractinoplanes atraurantiacus TaxID=1036182 RepID=A0A285IX22_9ACTN|nr:MFS transporter [Actinoplanes atraurantiacus]SNY52579.1 Transmembrane secretion effector [Actinoplanes atraurantiacus]
MVSMGYGRAEVGRRDSTSAAYRRLQAAAIVSNLGDGAFVAAVPLLAVTVTRDMRLVSLVAAVAAGAVEIRWLVVAAFLLGACEVVAGNAAHAALPSLVPVEDLRWANGRQFAATNTARTFAGPPIGGLLFGMGAGLPFVFDAVSFAASVVLLRRLPRRRPGPSPVPMRRAVGEGLRWLAGHRLLRALAILLALNLFCFQLATVTLVLLAVSVVTVSLRQTVVPAALLGRVNVVYRMLSAGLTPLGAVAGGFVAHDWGMRAAYPIAGWCGVLS